MKKVTQRTTSRVRLMLGLLVSLAAPVSHAADLPVFYKASEQKGTLQKNTKNWVTTLNARYGQGSARSGWAGSGGKINLLGIYGPTNMTRLGFNLSNLNNKPVTTDYFDPAEGRFIGRTAGDGTFTPQSYDATQGLVNFSGKLKTDQLDFTLEQNFFSGFYFQAYMPIRQVNLHNLGFSVSGNPALPVSAAADGKARPPVDLNAFMRDFFPAILQENGFQSWTTPYKKTGLSEVLLSLGWQGWNNTGFGIIEEATGRIQTGLIMPVSGGRDLSAVFSVPLGYDRHWGVQTRFELEVGMWKYLRLNALAGVAVFFDSDRMMRVNTDDKGLQQGWLMLETTRVDVDLGSIWDLAASVRAAKFCYGLTALVGYSFSRQEDARMLVRDQNYLKDLAAKLAAEVNAAGKPIPKYLSRNEIAGQDNRFRCWEQHVLHFLVGYDFREHRNAMSCAPIVAFEYATIIDGKRAGGVDMAAGSVGIQAKIPF